MRSRIKIRPNADNLSACLAPTPLTAEIELPKLNKSAEELLLDPTESESLLIFSFKFLFFHRTFFSFV